MFVYVRIQGLLWWLFINGVMLYGVVRPFQYRSLSGSGRMKYVHFGCVAAAIGLPLISVLICHWFGGYGMAVPLNYACLPRNKWAVTYSLLFPLTVCGIIGLSMLLCIGSELTKKVYKICNSAFGKSDRCILFYCLQRQKSKDCVKTDTCTACSEVKIIILTFVFVTVFLFYTVPNSLFFWRSDSIFLDIQSHFECEAKGKLLGSECGRESFNSLYSIFFMISSLLLSNFVIVLVVYIVNFNSLRKHF